MEKSAKKLGANMKKSQGDICRATGADRAYISNVESGNKNPTITKIAGALGVSIDKLTSTLSNAQIDLNPPLFSIPCYTRVRSLAIV